MKMHELFDMEEYEQLVAAKYIREQTHPRFPHLVVSNYTESCTWDKAWNNITLACRGLVWNNKTLDIVARPFNKFFNYGQEGAPDIALDKTVVVSEKMDGSMGVLYQTPDFAWAISTRGSFASEQAEFATQWFHDEFLDPVKSGLTEFGIDHYEYSWEPITGLTYIFEIIYPENRIVVDYGDREGLVLLGVVDINTGKSGMPSRGDTFDWPGEIVEFHEFETFGDVIASGERSNKEGFVVWLPETDERVKIKHEEYVILHRFMTNTSPKNIWEVLSAGQDPAETFALAPDEFHEWMKGVIEDLVTKYNALYEDAHKKYESIIESFGYDYWTRAEFAKLAAKEPNSALLFKILDSRSLDETIWKMIKPRGDEKMVMKPVDQDSN